MESFVFLCGVMIAHIPIITIVQPNKKIGTWPTVHADICMHNITLHTVLNVENYSCIAMGITSVSIAAATVVMYTTY